AEMTGNESLAKLKLVPLTTNHRSHDGILKLAANVIDLLCKGFPGVIDKLQTERGMFSGPLPTLFCGFSSEILATKRKKGSDLIVSNFGAEQVILVRDDEAKQRLQKQIGDENLILTVLESKGMEFEDVLIFN